MIIAIAPFSLPYLLVVFAVVVGLLGYEDCLLSHLRLRLDAIATRCDACLVNGITVPATFSLSDIC